MTGVVVTFADLEALGYCRKGTRQFFSRHELNWQLMLQGGLPVEHLHGIDDAMAHAAIEQATARTEEEANGRRG